MKKIMMTRKNASRTGRDEKMRAHDLIMLSKDERGGK